MTSSDGYSTFVWQTGQRSGRLNLRSFPVRRSRTGPSTCGITSPARVTSTQSPSRMSFASIRSKLWSVAVVTVTPPISTGSSTAYGLRAPVRPTLIRISLSFVIWTSGANLRATAQRAELGVQPQRVDLHHDAVGAIVQGGEGLLERGDCRVGAREIGHEGVMRFDRESPRRELLEQLVLRRDGELLARRFDVKAEDPQAPAAGDLG